MNSPIINARYGAALSHMAAGRLGEAERLFRSILAEDPASAPAAKGLGDIAFMSGDPAAAAACYSVALEFEPAHVGARVSLGMVLHGQGYASQARDMFTRAVADDPACAAAHYWLGFGLLEQGEVDAAVASLNQAAQLEPGLVGPLGASLYGFLERCDWREWTNLVRFMEAAANDAPRALFSPMTMMLVSGSNISWMWTR